MYDSVSNQQLKANVLFACMKFPRINLQHYTWKRFVKAHKNNHERWDICFFPELYDKINTTLMVNRKLPPVVG